MLKVSKSQKKLWSHHFSKKTNEILREFLPWFWDLLTFNVTLKPLKLDFETFGPMSQPVLEKLYVGKPKLKRQAQLKISKWQFYYCSKSAKNHYIQKNTKMHLTASFNVLEERFDQNIARKKKVSLEEDFFPWKCLQKRLFPLFCKFFNFRKHLKIYFIPECFIAS